MTDEQINIKIAELCGWKFKQRFLGEPYGIAPKEAATKLDPVHWNHELYEIPNYASDLNACREFEKTLTAKQQKHYITLLMLEGSGFMATAQQRCEAFLRVHGQWEEEA